MKVEATQMRGEAVKFNSGGAELAGTLFVPETSGVSPAMILCHGAGEFKEHYFEMAACLAERGVAALALDMHGHGASGGERFHVRMAEWIMDLEAAVRFLGTDPRIDATRVGAFGLSSGGTAILEGALRGLPFKALVLLDATVRNSMPLVNTMVIKTLVGVGWLKKLLTRKDWRVPVLKLFGNVKLVADSQLEAQLLADPRSTEAYMAFPFPGASESFFVNTLERVGKIHVPTLVVWGAEDQLDPPETAHLLFEALTCKKRLEVVEGNGHAGHLDRNKATVFSLTADWALANLA